MSENVSGACRLRVRYGKDGRLAHLGHLEVMGTIMRSVRRSALPFEVGNGFARRMRVQFSQALPVGASSRAEYYDLMLPEPLDEAEALRALVAATPPALAPQQVRLLPRRMPALEAWANRARWEVDLVCDAREAEEFPRLLEGVLQRGSIDFMRADKPRHLELGPTFVSCEPTRTAQGLSLVLDTRSCELGSLRPAVLMQAVVGHAPARVCRVGQWHEADDGTLLDPLA